MIRVRRPRLRLLCSAGEARELLPLATSEGRTSGRAELREGREGGMGRGRKVDGRVDCSASARPACVGDSEFSSKIKCVPQFLGKSEANLSASSSANALQHSFGVYGRSLRRGECASIGRSPWLWRRMRLRLQQFMRRSFLSGRAIMRFVTTETCTRGKAGLDNAAAWARVLCGLWRCERRPKGWWQSIRNKYLG